MSIFGLKPANPIPIFFGQDTVAIRADDKRSQQIALNAAAVSPVLGINHTNKRTCASAQRRKSWGKRPGWFVESPKCWIRLRRQAVAIGRVECVVAFSGPIRAHPFKAH